MILKESIANTFKICTALLFCAVAIPAIRVDSAMVSDYSPQDIEMVVGDIQSVKVKNLTRLSITDPSIADISDAKGDEVLLMARRSGQTLLFLWDESGKRSIVIRVIEEDMSLVKARILALIKKAEIPGLTLEENNYEGRVVITGEIEEDDQAKLDKILTPFDDKIINLTKQKVINDQIQIDMQITELNASDTRGLGFNWYNDSSQSAFKLLYQESNLNSQGNFADLFKIGEFNRTTAMLASVNAFVTEGKARVLSKPRLIVVSGKEASFLVGGQIPFQSTTLSTSGGQQTTETVFKDYGVNMTITPTIKNGKIEVDLNVEVSDPDGSISGNSTAFTTRTATTHLNLADGQTIVLAGLIKKNKSQEVKRLPFISKIPVVGLLFRAKSTGDKDTELVISLTPTILKSLVEAQIAAASAPAVPKAQAVVPAVNYASSSDPHDYAQALQKKISSAINYPYEAKENGWEGTVKISLRILKDGTLAEATIRQSSGYNTFDQDALNTAKVLAPYPAFSSDMDMDELVVVVPIVYSQKTSVFQSASNNQ
jgi:pilus assembly protein CpaC